MAKKTSTSKSIKVSSQASKNSNSKDLDIYEHKGSKRLNNPQVGLVNAKTEKIETKKTYKFDPHLDPQLQWAGKVEKNEFELPTVSLHVHERIDSRTIIEAVKKSPEALFKQLNLFNRPINKLNFVKEIQFYQYEKDWSNRLIAGDSLLVMNSLLEKEAMEGKIQTIYFDPPYGIKYGSNFQPFVNKREVKDGNDNDLTAEPEMIRAFRDTWSLSEHSYLTYLHQRLCLSRDLLSDTGSCFIQISDENSHRVRLIMDEIFGAKNFLNEISFIKTGGSTSKHLSTICDKIIWYAKDISKVKYRQLYEEKVLEETDYDFVEFEDLTYRRLTQEEKNNPKTLPKGSKIFALHSLKSSGFRENTTVSFEFENELFHPGPNNNWKTTIDGMKKLAKAGRIKKVGTSIRYVRYFNDFPIKPLTNIWSGSGASDMIYVVQTPEKPIARCILMTSDPGDIIFDPTCGSGTTAVVAEQFGRRWITCDTSRVATTLAKQRLLTNTYPYFSLMHPDQGISGGFVYKKAPHISLKDIATNPNITDKMPRQQIQHIVEENSISEDLYDQPVVDNKVIRVTGPFTVEAVPAPVVREMANSINGPSSISGPKDWISELLKTGIRLQNKKFLKLSRLEPMQGTKWLHAEGETQENPPQRIVVSFGSDFAPLEQRQVELALQEAEKIKPSPTVIVFAAFQFDPEAAKDIDEVEWGGVSVLKALMNADLFTEDLKKKRSSNESFWLVGQPDIEIKKIKTGEDKGKYSVTVTGFDYYNTKSGTIESGGANKIAMWMLDTDYDGRSLLPRQVFFPQAGDNEGWTKLAKSLRAEIDEELIEVYKGTESLLFEIGENKKIAVKIVDDRGIESLVVRDLE